MTKTITAVFERGIIKPSTKLPFREHAQLRLTLTFPSNPVSRTRGAIRVSPRTARAIIYGDDFDLYGA